MADIKKFIGDESVYSEAREHMLDLDEWNDEIAAQLAREQGIDLTPEHRAVLSFLRAHYLEHGPTSSRQLTAALDAEFASRGGRRYLYTLFPNGPVLQATRIAGLPVPHDASDPSFGSSM